jgi:hypothetical protein
MGEAMKYVAPVAAGLKVRFEETAAAIGLLGNAGIQASMAGTSLKTILLSLVAPSREARDIIERLGISAVDSSGNLLSLAEILEQFKKAGATVPEMETIFQKRAIASFLALMDQGAEKLRDFTVQLDFNGGVAKRVAETQMAGLRGAVKRLTSALEGLQIALAESGIMDWFTHFTNRLAKWISGLSGASKESHQFALKMALLVAAIGPALLIFGKLISALLFMQSPLGRLITIVGLLALAWRKWGDDIKRIVSDTFNWLNNIFTAAENWMGSIMQAALDHVVGGFKAAGRGLATAGTVIVEAMKTTAASVGEAFAWMGNILSGTFGPVIVWVKTAFKDLQNFVSGAIDSIADKVEEVLGVTALMPGHLAAPFEAALSGVKKLRAAIIGDSRDMYAEIGVGLAASMQRVAEAYRDSVDVDTGGIMDKLSAITQEISNFVSNPTAQLWHWAQDTADAIGHYVATTTGDVREMWLKVQKFLQDIGRPPPAVDLDTRPALEKIVGLGGAFTRMMVDAQDSINKVLGGFAFGGLSLHGPGIIRTALMPKGAAEDIARDLNRIQEAAVDSARRVGDAFVDATLEARNGFEALLETAQYVIRSILQAWTQMSLVDPLLQALNLVPQAAAASVGGSAIAVPGDQYSGIKSTQSTGDKMGGDGGAPLTVNFNVTANDAQGFDSLLFKRRDMIIGMVQEAYQRRGTRGGPVR